MSRLRIAHLAGIASAIFLGGVMVAFSQPPSAIPQDVPKDGAVKAPRPAIYDETAEASTQVAAAIQRAKADRTRVLIQWGANWCGWCHLLHDHFASNPEVARKLLYEYEVVLVDVGRMNKNLDLAAQYAADFKSSGIPYLTILDAEGNIVANQETGSLELPANPAGTSKPGHDVAKVLKFLTQHQAPYVEAQSILQDGLQRARTEGKTILLHFGAPWCGWCRRLETWMARPEVNAVLERYFVLVKIDVDRTVGGGAMMEQYTKGAKTGIPWFAFLDGDSRVIATSESPKGNIGCPHAPQELEAFSTMLRLASPAMTADEISGILSFLGEGDVKSSGTP